MLTNFNIQPFSKQLFQTVILYIYIRELRGYNMCGIDNIFICHRPMPRPRMHGCGCGSFMPMFPSVFMGGGYATPYTMPAYPYMTPYMTPYQNPIMKFMYFSMAQNLFANGLKNLFEGISGLIRPNFISPDRIAQPDYYNPFNLNPNMPLTGMTTNQLENELTLSTNNNSTNTTGNVTSTGSTNKTSKTSESTSSNRVSNGQKIDVNKLSSSENGINAIKKFEGCKLSTYQCSANTWTIGYGHTGNVKQGQTITQAQADAYLKSDIKTFENEVKRLVKVPLTQNQFDALVSFTYNVGSGNLAKSTLLKKLNAGDYNGAAQEFSKWTKSGGKQVQGLVTRRAAEKEMFLS